MELYIPGLHAITGVLVFMAGLLQFILQKGGRRHILLGRIYLYCWFILVATGAYIGGLLITIIGIFGLYFTVTGARVAMLKNRAVTWIDQAIIGLGSIILLSMLFYAVWLLWHGKTSFGIIFSVFSVLFLLTIQHDVCKYLLKTLPPRAQYGKMDWYFEHMNRMSISFIACVTAFASIQDVFRNNTLNFLLPTAIGIVSIVLMRKQHEKKVLG